MESCLQCGMINPLEKSQAPILCQMDPEPELLGPILSLQSIYPAPTVYYQPPSNEYTRGKTQESLWMGSSHGDGSEERRSMEIEVDWCVGRKRHCEEQ